MGIQSGSEHIRKDVFHRYETQQDIIGATRAIRSAGVAWATYDFMLQHPFETTQDLQETYWLVKRLCPPFALQLHGLNFLPGTDIVNLAIEQNYFTQEELMSIMYAPMEEQFGTYWKRDGGAENRLWYQMIYCLQFRPLRRLMSGYEHEPVKVPAADTGLLLGCGAGVSYAAAAKKGAFCVEEHQNETQRRRIKIKSVQAFLHAFTLYFKQRVQPAGGDAAAPSHRRRPRNCV